MAAGDHQARPVSRRHQPPGAKNGFEILVRTALPDCQEEVGSPGRAGQLARGRGAPRERNEVNVVGRELEIGTNRGGGIRADRDQARCVCRPTLFHPLHRLGEDLGRHELGVGKIEQVMDGNDHRNARMKRTEHGRAVNQICSSFLSRSRYLKELTVSPTETIFATDSGVENLAGKPGQVGLH